MQKEKTIGDKPVKIIVKTESVDSFLIICVKETRTRQRVGGLFGGVSGVGCVGRGWSEKLVGKAAHSIHSVLIKQD